MPHSRPRRLLAATLITSMLATAGPASAAAVLVLPNGTFWPKYVDIPNGGSVTWYGLTRKDGIARIAAAASSQAVAGTVDRDDVCGTRDLADPGYANPYQQAFDGTDLDPTGPDRFGHSGIWALGPEGGSVSMIAIPSPEAFAIDPGIETRLANGEVPDCDWLEAAVIDEVPVPDDPTTAIREHLRYVNKTIYDRVLTQSGLAREAAVADTMAWSITDPAGAPHVLCAASYARCDVNDTDGNGDPDPLDVDGDGDLVESDAHACTLIEADPAVPATLPPGTYLNGLMSSTYANPDIAGVVLRFNWKDLQYDLGGTITERWEHLDRELERAIAVGKRVTLDVRAGMFGTPDWIFDGYLTPDDPADDRPASYHAAWCPAGGGACAFAAAHPSAGQVEPLAFVDHYEETPPGTGCGSLVRIGSPGDAHYRALYQDFVARLAAHVASDARWFQAVAHVKVSGANLRTSEAELPHHCDDEFANTGDYVSDPKAAAWVAKDRVLDTFKTQKGNGTKTLAECVCNTEVWWNAGYTPAQLYDYYAELEQAIVASFFGRKSLGYQIIQDGFPRTDADGGTFYGDHLYRETLVDSAGTIVNAGLAAGATCASPDPEVDDLAGAPQYCSADVSPTLGANVAMVVTPILPDLADPDVADAAAIDNSGTRYPGAHAQAETILAEAASGRFADPYGAAGGNDHLAGKLFVPQHSGLQVLPQERVDLGYATEPTTDPCLQERARLDVTGVWWTWAANAVGGIVADFPIPNFHPISELSDPLTAGCPNRWIVEEGTDHHYRAVTVSLPGGPGPVQLLVPTPPQLTGFQTTNAVRSPAHVESALLNLTYNSNAVFVELYEDAVWRIGTLRGTGPSAQVIDADNVRRAYCTVGVDYYCYSKNLRQWAEELHARRVGAAVSWANFNGEAYPALASPWAVTYTRTFTNTTGLPQDLAYINPTRCDPTWVDQGPLLNNAASALGTIRVQP